MPSFQQIQPLMPSPKLGDDLFCPFPCIANTIRLNRQSYSSPKSVNLLGTSIPNQESTVEKTCWNKPSGDQLRIVAVMLPMPESKKLVIPSHSCPKIIRNTRPRTRHPFSRAIPNTLHPCTKTLENKRLHLSKDLQTTQK